MKDFLKTTAGWGIICCILAATSPALAWSYFPGWELSATGTKVAALIPVAAYADWHGAAITITGGVGVLFLLATGSVKPIPWWRVAGLAVVGVTLLVFILIYSTTHWNHFPVQETGGLLAILSTMGLSLVVAMDLRGILERRMKAKANS